MLRESQTRRLVRVAEQQFLPVQGGLVAQQLMAEEQIEDIHQNALQLQTQFSQLQRVQAETLQSVRNLSMQHPRGTGCWRAPAPANIGELQYCIQQLECRLPANLWPEDDDDDDFPADSVELQRRLGLEAQRKLWQQRGKK